MREVSFGQDGSYSPEAIVTRCNAELANSFGNLAQRVLSMIFKNLDGELAAGRSCTMTTTCWTQVSQVDVLNAILPSALSRALAFSIGLEAWMSAVFACNALCR